VDVLITDEGIALLKNIEKNEGDFENRFISISEKEINILNDLLDKLRG